MKEDLEKIIGDLKLKSDLLKNELLLNRKVKIYAVKSKDFIKISEQDSDAPLSSRLFIF